MPHRLRASRPIAGATLSIVRQSLRRSIAPRIKFTFAPAASRPFPLSLGRQTKFPPHINRQPLAIASRLKPRHTHHRLCRLVKIGIMRKGRRRRARCRRVPVIFPICNLARGQQKFIHPYAMHRSLAVLSYDSSAHSVTPALASHQKPPGRDRNERQFPIVGCWIVRLDSSHFSCATRPACRIL